MKTTAVPVSHLQLPSRIRLSARLPDFITLMKPRVMLLAVFTALVGLIIAPGHLDPLLGFVAILSIAAGAGAAGVLNMWYDADIDAETVKPVTVQVVSLDWKWLFIYPEQGIASVNQLTIPVGTPISFELTSSGVMNSFFVPQLGSQIYTMAGMVTRVQLQADHPGKYPGLSAQFSGDGFADMRFTVDAVPAENFAQWVDAARSAGPVLDAQAYEELVKPSQAVAPFTYQAVAPRLFSSIWSSEMQSDDALCLASPASQRVEK